MRRSARSGGGQPMSELELIRAKRGEQRQGRRGERITTNQLVKDAKRNLRSLKKLEKFGLNGSEAGFIRNAVGGQGMSVEVLNGVALQGKKEREALRQERREMRRSARAGGGQPMSELELIRAKRGEQRQGRRGERITTNQLVKDAKRNLRSLKKLEKFGLNGSEAGFIRNAVGGQGMSVEVLNGVALQGKKEREARKRKRQLAKQKREQARARKKELKRQAKEKRIQKKIKRRELTGQERRTKRREERKTKRAERQAQRQEARADRQQKRRDDRLARQEARQEARAERQAQRQASRGDGPLANIGDKLSDITGNIFGGGDDSELRSGGGGDSGGGFFDSPGGGAIADFVEDQTGIDLASDEDILEQRDDQEKQKAMLPLIIGGGAVVGYLLYNQSKKKKGKKRK